MTTDKSLSSDFIEFIKQLLDDLEPLLKQFLDSLGKLFQKLEQKLETLLGSIGLKKNPILKTLLVNMIKDQMEIYKPVIKANDKFFDLINKVKKLLKI